MFLPQKRPKKILSPTLLYKKQENRAQKTYTSILEPEPNNHLMGIELSKTIEKQLSDENMSIEQVVMGIFKGNPNDMEIIISIRKEYIQSYFTKKIKIPLK